MTSDRLQWFIFFGFICCLAGACAVVIFAGFVSGIAQIVLGLLWERLWKVVGRG